MKFTIGDVVKNPENGERFVTITLSNSDIKIIKSSVEAYQGDKDDPKFREKMEKVRSNIHETWKALNPS